MSLDPIEAAFAQAQAMIDALGTSAARTAEEADRIEQDLFQLEVAGVSRDRALSVTVDFQGVPKAIDVPNPSAVGGNALRKAILDAQLDAHRRLAVRLRELIDDCGESALARQMVEPILERLP
jgi:DNA-binding protein YbaB